MPSRCGQGKFAFAFFDILRSSDGEGGGLCVCVIIACVWVCARTCVCVCVCAPRQSEIEYADIFVKKITTIK